MPFPSQYGTVNKSVHQHNLQMAVQKVHVPQQDKGQWVPWVSSLLGFRQGLRRGVREEKGAGKPWECMSTQIKAALQEACYWSKVQTACRAWLPSEVACFTSEKQEEKGSETSGDMQPSFILKAWQIGHHSLSKASKFIKDHWVSARAGAHGCSATSRAQGSKQSGPVKVALPMAERLELNHPQGPLQAKPSWDSLFPSCSGRNLFSGALQKGF